MIILVQGYEHWDGLDWVRLKSEDKQVEMGILVGREGEEMLERERENYGTVQYMFDMLSQFLIPCSKQTSTKGKRCECSVLVSLYKILLLYVVTHPKN